MAVEATNGLTGEMMTYYESVFLERNKYAMIYNQGAQKKSHGKNKGKVILFNRYAPLSVDTTALTEGAAGTERAISASTVEATLAEYGDYIKVSKLLKLTSIDVDAKEKVELIGQNKGETIDRLTREALYSGATADLGSVAALTDIAATDVLTAAKVRKCVRELKKAYAMPYQDGYFLGKTGPDASYDLQGDSTWVNAATYDDGNKALYTGEIGKLHKVRFIEAHSQKSESSTVTVYSTFIHGQHAFGCYDLEGDVPGLYIKVPGTQDTSNPLDRFYTIGWAGTYVAKVLISTWIRNLKTGVTA